MGRLANKNILITGGNSGIGLAAAQEFDRGNLDAMFTTIKREFGHLGASSSMPVTVNSCRSKR